MKHYFTKQTDKEKIEWSNKKIDEKDQALSAIKEEIIRIRKNHQGLNFKY